MKKNEKIDEKIIFAAIYKRYGSLKEMGADMKRKTTKQNLSRKIKTQSANFMKELRDMGFEFEVAGEGKVMEPKTEDSDIKALKKELQEAKKWLSLAFQKIESLETVVKKQNVEINSLNQIDKKTEPKVKQ